MKTAVLALSVLLAGCAGAPLQELAPTGVLRIGIGVGPVPSAFWATRNRSGSLRGVTVDLANELARETGLPLRLVVFPNSGEVIAATSRGELDVAFAPADAERAKLVDFGAAYYLSTSTYLVPRGSSIRTMADVDRPGVRVVGVEGTTTARSASRSLKNTPLETYKTADELLQMVSTGKADAVALGLESLKGFSARLPGSRILDGHYHAAPTAVAVPKGRPDALEYVSDFVERAKANGTVRRALDGAGLKDAQVAPAGAR